MSTFDTAVALRSSYQPLSYSSPESDDKKSAAPANAAEPDAENVKLVMAQAECSEEKAVEALKKADGDLITASTLF